MGALDKYVDGSKREDALLWKKRHESAQSLADDGKLDEAIALYRTNLGWSLETLGKDHNSTVCDQEALASTLFEAGKFEEARDLDEAALATRIRVEGEDPPSKLLLEVQVNLAKDLVRLKRYKRAVALFQKTYDTYKEDDIQSLKILYDIAACWHSIGDHEKSRTLNQKVLDTRLKLGAPPEQVASSRDALKQNEKKIESARKKREKTAKEVQEKESSASLMSSKGTMDTAGKAAEQQLQMHFQEKASTAKEARMKERAQKKEAEDKAEADKAAARRAQAHKSALDLMAKYNAGKAVEHQDTGNFKTTAPIAIPSINVQKPQQRASSVPKSDSGFRPGAPAPGTENQGKSRVRANSQDSRPIQFRHVQRPVDVFQPGMRSPAGNLIPAGPMPVRLGVTPSKPPTPEPSMSTSPKCKPEQATKAATIPSHCPPPQHQKSTGSSSLSTGQASQSTPDLSRSQSLTKGRRKDPPAPRASSASPSPAEPHRNPYRQLFDAQGGNEDHASSHAVKSWFYSLEAETQQLLKPHRRSHCKRVKIAILDTGVDLTHPEFKEDQALSRMSRRIKVPEDFLDPTGSAVDTCGHGTHCVGLLRLIAPEADIYVARVAKDFNGILDADVVAKAIDRACSDGKDNNGQKNWNVDILTMFFGFYGRSPVVQTAIQQALSKPTLVFAAASNNGTRREMAFPAWLQGVICVNSANADGVPSSFNPPLNPGKNFSFVGENVRSTWTSQQDGGKISHKLMSGTSVATPIAAAVAALVLEYVLQNEPESPLLEQLDDFKQYDGMTQIFGLMSKAVNGYRNVVPWSLLATGDSRAMVSMRIQWEMKKFKGQ